MGIFSHNKTILIRMYLYILCYFFLLNCPRVAASKLVDLIVWGHTYATTLNPIVVLHKKAVRTITSSNRDAHCSPLFFQLGLIKFMDLVTFHTALFLFQFHHNLLPKAFDNFFSRISSKHGYNTRLASKSTYYVDQVRTNYGKFNIHFSGPSLWNNMAENLKTCSSLHLFKHMNLLLICWLAWYNFPYDVIS